MSEVVVYAVGFVHASACAPSEMPGEDLVADLVERLNLALELDGIRLIYRQPE